MSWQSSRDWAKCIDVTVSYDPVFLAYSLVTSSASHRSTPSSLVSRGTVEWHQSGRAWTLTTPLEVWLKEHNGSHALCSQTDRGSSRAVGEIFAWDPEVTQLHYIFWTTVLMCDSPVTAWASMPASLSIHVILAVYRLPVGVFPIAWVRCIYIAKWFHTTWCHASTIATIEVLLLHWSVCSNSDQFWPPYFPHVHGQALPV